MYKTLQKQTELGHIYTQQQKKLKTVFKAHKTTVHHLEFLGKANENDKYHQKKKKKEKTTNTVTKLNSSIRFPHKNQLKLGHITSRLWNIFQK